MLMTTGGGHLGRDAPPSSPILYPTDLYKRRGEGKAGVRLLDIKQF